MLNQNVNQASITEATTVQQLEGLLLNGITNKEITPELGAALIKMIKSNGVVANPGGGSTANLLPISVGQVTFPTTGVPYSMGVNGYYTFVTPYTPSRYSEMGSYFNLNGSAQPIWYSGVRCKDYPNSFSAVNRGNTDSYAEFTASFESNSGFDLPEIAVVSSADTTGVGGSYKYDSRVSLNADNVFLERLDYSDNSRNLLILGEGGVRLTSIDTSAALKQVVVLTNSVSHSVSGFGNNFQGVKMVEFSFMKEFNSSAYFSSIIHRLPTADSNATALTKFGNNRMYLDENTGVVKLSCPVYPNASSALADINLANYSNYFNSSTNKYATKVNP